jgi:hypothetical protein
MTQYVIIPDAEMPSYNQRFSKYPFPEMNVGDAFDITFGDESRRVSTAAYSYGRKNKMEFTCRRISEDLMRIKRVG